MLLSDMQAFKAANPGCCLLGEPGWRRLCLQAGCQQPPHGCLRRCQARVHCRILARFGRAVRECVASQTTPSLCQPACPRRLCEVAFAKGLRPGSRRQLEAVQAHGSRRGYKRQLRARNRLEDLALPPACLKGLPASPDDPLHQVISRGAEPTCRPHLRLQGNAWQQLWSSAVPLPAARQRPLLDPQLEGERVLHFLEMLPPAALYAELLAVGYSAALQLLRTAGPAAQLPAAQEQLRCLEAAARLELLHGVAATEVTAEGSEQQLNGSGGAGLAAAAAEPAPGAQANESAVAKDADGWEDEWEAEQDEEQRAAEPPPRLPPQPAWLQSVFSSGMSGWRYRRLLQLLGCAEQTVVAAHSLMLRLGWHPRQQLAMRNMDGSAGSGGDFAASVADQLLATALGEQQPLPREPQLAADGPELAPTCAVDLAATHRQAAEALIASRWDDEPADDSGTDSVAGQAVVKWPAPFQQEWLLQVRPGHAPSNGSQHRHGDPGNCSSALPVLQRMYVKALPAGVRIATVLSAEPCGQS